MRVLRDPGGTCGLWQARYVVSGKPADLVRRPFCGDRTHRRIYTQLYESGGVLSDVCACEVESGRAQLAMWEMPADARHVLSPRGFEDRETGRCWVSTHCGVLWESAGAQKPCRLDLVTQLSVDRLSGITCPGCALRVGRPLEEIGGLVLSGAAPWFRI